MYLLFYFLYFKVKAITSLISEWFGKRVNNRYRVSRQNGRTVEEQNWISIFIIIKYI